MNCPKHGKPLRYVNYSARYKCDLCDQPKTVAEKSMLRRFPLAVLLCYLPTFLLLGVAAFAQTPTESLEIRGNVEKVTVDKVVIIQEQMLLVKTLPFTISAPKGGFGYQWTVPAGFDILRKGESIEVKAAPKGNATVSAEWYVVDFDKRVVLSKFGSTSFAVGDVPQPIPPKPPIAPDPPLSPAPIPVDGLRVLIVEETEQRPDWLAAILADPIVRGFLNANCAKGPDGKTPEWRVHDQDQDMSRAAALWQDVMKRPRKAMPWLIISNGKTGYEDECPKTPKEFITLVAKFVETPASVEMESDYQQARRAAIDENKPLVVFVSTRPFPIPNVITAYAVALDGYPKSCTVVALPKNGELYHAKTLPPGASIHTIQETIRARVEPMRYAA